MRMSEGVEWALHCCLALAWFDDKEAVPTSRLAAAFDLKPSYLNKIMQALVRAEILSSTAGVKGGFRLAKRPQDITFLDVVTAIEGPPDIFRCTELRRRGIGAAAPARSFVRPCGIAAAMRRAEEAWRQELAKQTVADMMAVAPETTPDRFRCFLRT